MMGECWLVEFGSKESHRQRIVGWMGCRRSSAKSPRLRLGRLTTHLAEDAWRQETNCSLGFRFAMVSGDQLLLSDALGVRRSEAVQGQHRLGSDGVRMVLV